MPQRNHHSARRRGAAVYVAVLGAAFMISMIGLCAIQVARLELRGVVDDNDMREARLLATSAIERAAAAINADPAWRTTYASGNYYPATPAALGGGEYRWKLVDDDGNLADDVNDPVRIHGAATVGRAAYAASANSIAHWPPLSCLETALCAGDNISFGAAVVTCDQIISTNNTTSASGTVTSDVEAVTAINGGAYIGSITTGITPRELPDASVFDYYVTNGAAINIAGLPEVGGYREINDAVISANLNPYGSTNAEGLYVIDCLGAAIRIRNSRIIGTLVLLNPGPGSVVDGAMNWTPAVSNYPALMVSGSLDVNTTTLEGLSEPLRLTNFNPVGAPYLGSTDADTLDVYPATIQGLVYVSGVLSTAASPAFDGVVVVGGEVSTSGELNLSYQSIYLDNPPPGFLRSYPDMWLEPASWRREPSP